MSDAYVPGSEGGSTLNVESLYSNHYRWLLGWLQRRMGNAFDAADLTHDTFERVLTRLDQVLLREPRAYLSTIAHGLVVNHWRRLEIERACLDTLALGANGLACSPEDTAIVLEALCELDALLDRLNPKARTAFLLAQLDGLTYADIAVRLAVSERMVKKYMAQAMLHCLQSDASTLLIN